MIKKYSQIKNSNLYPGALIHYSTKTTVFYRGGGKGSVPRNKTLKDILEYEREELGNDISLVLDVDPAQISSNNLYWVCKKKKDAEYYGDVSPVVFSKYRILAKDSQGGFLVEDLGKTAKTKHLFPEMSDKHLDDVKWLGKFI